VATPATHPPSAESYLVHVDVHGVLLEGQLSLPPSPRGIVFFAHGSGSSRHSPRNKVVAQALRDDAGLGTLLVDLLSPFEEAIDIRTAELRFDIPFLTARVRAICDWLGSESHTGSLPIGIFAASTGAAAALVAAAERPEQIRAVVSRAGRPDLAGPSMLAKVRAPTLFLVGGDDHVVIDLNRRAMHAMTCEHRLEIVHGAGHLFEEPGKLGEVSRRATRWFAGHIRPRGAKR